MARIQLERFSFRQLRLQASVKLIHSHPESNLFTMEIHYAMSLVTWKYVIRFSYLFVLPFATINVE